MIKEHPEDFVVEEVINLNYCEGDYLYVKLTKINWNTLDVINEIVNRLRIKRKQVGFAGSKDKRAVTTQYVSLYKVSKKQIENLRIKDVKLEVACTGKRPISLGDLEGNKFRIKFKTKNKIDYIVNYFGPQRFSENNPEIGKLIITKDFKGACKLINNEKIKGYLLTKVNDYIGALKLLDKKLLSLYINSYQAYLWNEVVKKYVSELGVSKIKVPLIAFDTEFVDEKISKIYEGILKNEKITQRDFLIRSFPEITPTSTDRDLLVEVKDFKNDGGYVEFFLPKGSYATVVLKELERFLN